MMMENINQLSDANIEEFNRLQPLNERLIDEVQYILRERLQTDNINAAALIGRVKDLK